eukprot:TRINITY_DN60556_c0_g1_i1.p1 TRINITY_DN60556_c0_g1~~TRINITY_DN60556_c0_g1_i1.p1  ORF type:complete len:367 (+),score=80.58 TRINITY_DN60556_c0_g1_i1:99-1103(+)
MALADGSWQCMQCGNLNRSHRTQCNMRKCQAPRPDMAVAGFAPPPAVHGGHPGIAPQPNDWQCPNCGNRNRSHRERCNMRNCQALRPGLDESQASQQLLPTSPEPGVAAAPNEPKDWVCPQCGNTNFGHRMVCNMRMCGAPRPSDSSPPGMQVPQGLPVVSLSSGPDAGQNWTCHKCGNSNYPSRTVCNMRTCKEPRPMPGMSQRYSPYQVPASGGAMGAVAGRGAGRMAGGVQGTAAAPPTAGGRATTEVCNLPPTVKPLPEVEAALYSQLPPELPQNAMLAYVVPQDVGSHWQCVRCGTQNPTELNICSKCVAHRPLHKVQVVQIERADVVY